MTLGESLRILQPQVSHGCNDRVYPRGVLMKIKCDDACNCSAQFLARRNPSETSCCYDDYYCDDSILRPLKFYLWVPSAIFQHPALFLRAGAQQTLEIQDGVLGPTHTLSFRIPEEVTWVVTLRA